MFVHDTLNDDNMMLPFELLLYKECQNYIKSNESPENRKNVFNTIWPIYFGLRWPKCAVGPLSSQIKPRSRSPGLSTLQLVTQVLYF